MSDVTKDEAKPKSLPPATVAVPGKSNGDAAGICLSAYSRVFAVLHFLCLCLFKIQNFAFPQV
jgi:hypothetical protein